jgi:hypothetical protein
MGRSSKIPETGFGLFAIVSLRSITPLGHGPQFSASAIRNADCTEPKTCHQRLKTPYTSNEIVSTLLHSV